MSESVGEFLASLRQADEEFRRGETLTLDELQQALNSPYLHDEPVEVRFRNTPRQISQPSAASYEPWYAIALRMFKQRVDRIGEACDAVHFAWSHNCHRDGHIFKWQSENCVMCGEAYE